MLRPLFCAALAFSVSRAAAGTPAPPGPADLQGARALAISAYRGIAPGNDGLFTNPAGLAALRRYAIEGQYLLDRAGAESDAQFYGASVVDSQSGPMAGGFAYTHMRSGDVEGSVTHLALAMPLGRTLFLGGSAKYLSLDGESGWKVRAATADAGLFWRASSYLSIGAAGYNLIPIGHPGQAPRALGTGICVGTDTTFHVSADWRGDFERAGDLTSSYGVGGEYLLAKMFPVRAGYLRDDTLGGQWWSAGLGIVTAEGVALDLAYRQAIGAPGHRTFGIAFKLFLASAQ